MSTRTSIAPRTLLGAALGLVAGLAGAAACTITNYDHCFFHDGTCADSGLVCDKCSSVNNGCVALADLTEGCLVPSGSSATSTDSDPSTTTSVGTTTSSTTTTEPTTSTTEPTTDPTITSSTTSTSDTGTTGFVCDPAEPVSPECLALDPSQPFCVASNTCGSCSDLQVTCGEATGGALPACDAASGLCVECTPDDADACTAKEVCNPYTLKCGECTEHEQCGSGACNLQSGECFDASAVVWVQQKGSCSLDVNDPALGTEAKPLCKIIDPLNLDKWANKPELVIFVKSGISPQVAVPAATIDGKSLAIIGVGEPMPVITDASPDPLLAPNGGAKLFVDRLELRGASNAGAAIDCSGNSVLWVDRSRIVQNGGGMSANVCEVHVRRTVLTSNKAGSTFVGASQVVVENSFVTANDIKVSGGALVVKAPASLQMSYSTIADNTGAAATSGVLCDPGTSVSIRNSILLGDLDPIFAACDADDGGNFIGAAIKVMDLFQSLKDGIYRPKPGAAEIDDIAIWKIGDPYVDFDGELRPNEDGVSDFAGADRP